MSAPRPEYGGDLALFDVDLVPNIGDLRSVGELLVDADWQARQLMHVAAGEDAAAMVRTWPRVAAAANGLWSALPRGTAAQRAAGEPFEVRGDRQMSQIVEVAQTMADHVRQSAGGRVKHWPDDGPRDVRVDELADTLQRAGALVRRYGSELPIDKPGVHADLSATRARLMHAVYVSSHAIRYALHEHGRDLHRASAEAGRPLPLVTHASATGVSPYDVAPIGVWVSYMNRTERLAGEHARALDSDKRAPEGMEDSTRLRRALTTWDAAATRTLTGTTVSAEDLALVTGGQQFIAGWGCTVVAAADHDASLAAADALHETTEAWADLHQRWRDLASPIAQPDQGLVTAFGEVRAALRELTHMGSERIDTATMRTHPLLQSAAESTLEAVRNAPDLADHLARHASTAYDREAPARPIVARLKAEADTGHESPDVNIVPLEIQRNARVPVPAAVAAGIERSTSNLRPLLASAASEATTRPAPLSAAARAALDASRHAKAGAALRQSTAPKGAAARVDRGVARDRPRGPHRS